MARKEMYTLKEILRYNKTYSTRFYNTKWNR